MRTKLLRFNKQLPRIDTAHPGNQNPGTSASPFQPSPNRRTEGPEINMNDMVQAVMKQSQHGQSY